LHLKLDLTTSSLSFVSLSWSRITDKLASNWQNFARVRLQLKFAFIIRPARHGVASQGIMPKEIKLYDKLLYL